MAKREFLVREERSYVLMEYREDDAGDGLACASNATVATFRSREDAERMGALLAKQPE